MPKMWLLCCLSLCLMCSGLRAGSPQTLKIFSRETPIQLHFELNDQDWRWLGKKQQLNIALYGIQNPPFDMALESGVFEGLSADYSLLLAHSLGVRIKVLRYPNRAAALQGLSQGQVDLMVDYADDDTVKTHSFLSSMAFTSDANALVTREQDLTREQPKNQDMRIALLRGAVSDEWIEKHYPDAKITRYTSSSSALSSVAFGHNDYFIGSLITTSYLIERSYDNLLAVADIVSNDETGPHFLFRSEDANLQRMVNAVLKSIPLTQHKAISRQWSSGQDLWQFQSGVVLTAKELKWLQQNREQRVVINPLYAPFTMFDENGQFYGISADILQLIHLRTGLNFKAVETDSVADMFQMVKQHKGDMIAAMSYSEARDKQLMFTRPYVQPAFALVVKNKVEVAPDLSDIKALAITTDNSLWEWLKAHHPHIKLVKADNASLAMQWVKENKVDGAVHNLIGANYMIDRYFRGELKVASQLGDQVSHIGFAVPRDKPELYSILNKALADISPRDISMISNKWQGTPAVKLDTWTVYRTEFYWLAGLFAALVLSSLFWIYYLRREISKRKEIQSKLQEQVVFRETLFNSMPVPIYVIDLEGHVLSHNQAWEAFFKLDISDLKHLALISSMHPLFDVYATLKELPNDVKGVALFRHRYSIHNGEEMRVVIHQAVPYVDIKSEVVGYICSWQDITEHEELLVELSAARERAEQASRTKSTFLATMSHEIRTPISAIVGLLELTVTNKTFTQTDMDAIKVAYESAQSLMGLVGEILDMAKIESGELELAPKWTPFDELITPVVRVFDGLARQKNLTLYSDICVLHPDEIYIDALRLHQILSNLISNAIKFTEQGSVEVQVKFLRNNEQLTLLELSVTDTGIGIAEADQKQIFAPYKQSDAGKMQTGTGLGLAICSQLVEMMGGVITLRSQLGKGTHITVHIPVEQRQSTQTIVAQSADVPSQMQPLNILAVDDHPANRLLLRSQLARLGHDVVEAENGDQALQLWRSHEFDLVITDCNMPIMDGLTLTRLLRQEQTQPLTIFGLTANAQPEERARCLVAGMDDCLFKPLRLAQLETLLNKVSRQTQQAEVPKILLEDLVDLNALRQLVQGDTLLLEKLLLTTRDENIKDLQQLRLFTEQQDANGLTRCFHRLAGAAQIVGAAEVEQYCRELERYCERGPDFDVLNTKVEQIMVIVTQLNDAIDEFVAKEQ